MTSSFKFGFIGLYEAPPAKEIEGLGQPLSFARSNLTRGGGKETSAFEMVPAPFPATALKMSLAKKMPIPRDFHINPKHPGAGGKEPSQTPKFLSPLPW